MIKGGKEMGITGLISYSGHCYSSSVDFNLPPHYQFNCLMQNFRCTETELCVIYFKCLLISHALIELTKSIFHSP